MVKCLARKELLEDTQHAWQLVGCAYLLCYLAQVRLHAHHSQMQQPLQRSTSGAVLQARPACVLGNPALKPRNKLGMTAVFSTALADSVQVLCVSSCKAGIGIWHKSKSVPA